MPGIDIGDIFEDIVSERNRDQALTDARPVVLVKGSISASERRLTICASCYHLKRYHILTPVLLNGVEVLLEKCKYETCKNKCKGYKQKETNDYKRDDIKR